MGSNAHTFCVAIQGDPLEGCARHCHIEGQIAALQPHPPCKRVQEMGSSAHTFYAPIQEDPLAGRARCRYIEGCIILY